MTILQTAHIRLYEALQMLEEHSLEFPKDKIAKRAIKAIFAVLDTLEMS